MKSGVCRECAKEASRLDLVLSLVQSLFRIVLGQLSGSTALMAQGVYSLGDFLTKGITYASLRLAQRPPSKYFPFGFGKVQFLSSAVVGMSLLGGGVYMGGRNLLLINVDADVPNGIALIGVALSGAASWLMYLHLGCVIRQNNSPAIEASALDNRIDAISSGAVLIGILIANLGMPSADRAAAIAVSILGIRTGGIIAAEAIKGLLDVSVPQDTLEDIARICRLTVGIQKVELIRGRSLGESWEIYIQIAVDDRVTAGDAQQMVDGLRVKIRDFMPRVQHVWVVTVPTKGPSQDHPDYWSSHLFTQHPGMSEPMDGPTDPERLA